MIIQEPVRLPYDKSSKNTLHSTAMEYSMSTYFEIKDVTLFTLLKVV